MKKFLALFLAVVFCFTLLCSCSKNTEGAPDGMKAVESSDKLDYNIYIPAHWIQDLSTGVVSAYVSNSDLSNISMTQYNLEELKPLDDYVKQYTDELTANLDELKMSEGYPQKMILDGVEAKKLEYTASLAGNTYKFMQVICIKGATIYYFTYTALSENYDANAEDVQKILDNFAFKKK
ncbi:MAG: DcrB-related protein [Clostridia bacterium]|nr:DcrB-related protein [Clostridia bacterium]